MTTTISRKQKFLNYLKDPTRAKIESACKEFQNTYEDCITFIGIIDENEKNYTIKITVDGPEPIHISQFLEILTRYTKRIEIKHISSATNPIKHWAFGAIYYTKRIDAFTKIFYLIKKSKND